ncbi:hypothetical protein [Bradyrhizobium sp. 17]|uniref:hypothetical protein n=1 Tax=Bradyrhizobium sp. 17 TaxID=2782649 RepID=UPI001FF922DE|nr:hypothetical protein [Bradyrhizobium sp. 17]
MDMRALFLRRPHFKSASTLAALPKVLLRAGAEAASQRDACVFAAFEFYAIQMLVPPHNFAPQSTLEAVNRQVKLIGENADRRAKAGSFFAEISHNTWMNSTNVAKAEQRGLID